MLISLHHTGKVFLLQGSGFCKVLNGTCIKDLSSQLVHEKSGLKMKTLLKKNLSLVMPNWNLQKMYLIDRRKERELCGGQIVYTAGKGRYFAWLLTEIT